MNHKTFMILTVLMTALQAGESSQSQRGRREVDVKLNQANVIENGDHQVLSSKVASLVSVLNSCERERDMLKKLVDGAKKNNEETTLKLKALINACEQESSKANVIAEQSLRKLEEEYKLLFDYMVTSELGTPYPGVIKYSKYIVTRFRMQPLTQDQALKPEFGPVMNDVVNFRYLTNIPKCIEVASGNDQRPSIFIAIISATENSRKRNIIRNTWKRHLRTVRDKRGFYFLHFGFFLGIPNDMAAQKMIEDETNVHKDIIQIDMIDSYRNLTLKVAGVLNWINRNCKTANFVFKVDDDIYVNVHNLAYFVELNRQERNIFGRIPRDRNDNNWGPMRDGQHGISLDAWPWTTYPDYIQGSAYLIHGDLILPLLAAFQTTPMIPFEDVFLTGIAAEKAGIKKRFSQGQPRCHDATVVCRLSSARRLISESRGANLATRFLWDGRSRGSEKLDPEEERKHMMLKAFQTFDSDKKGYIESSKVSTILQMMNLNFDKEELARSLIEHDPKNSGKINFDGFAAIASDILDEEDDEAMQKELRDAFRLYDKEGNGYITTQTLKDILAQIDDKLTSDDLDGMIEEIDIDGTGRIDVEGFVNMMCS
ncbi:troponin C [Daphnia sinensis]|uniref:Troponin C n=2 Tax=Daphnia TaxID=6668 RepID=A0AAD5L4W9_9CRUS|nr:troponin C [Daphnia sinensis]